MGQEGHGEGGHLQVMVARRRAAATVGGPAAAVAASAAVAAARGGELVAGGVDVGGWAASVSVRGLEHSAAVHVQSQCLAVLEGERGA